MFNSRIRKENANLKGKIEIMTREQKSDNFNFILILEQIQQINNTSGAGKGAVLKGYTKRKEGINDVIESAKEKIEQKIMELD